MDPIFGVALVLGLLALASSPLWRRWLPRRGGTTPLLEEVDREPLWLPDGEARFDWPDVQLGHERIGLSVSDEMHRHRRRA